MTANVATTYEGLKLEYKILADDFINMLSRRQSNEEETLQVAPDVSKRIGIAKGEFLAPDDFDANNEEIYAMLMERIEKVRKAGGMLHKYADPNKISLEEGAFERAMVEKYAVN